MRGRACCPTCGAPFPADAVALDALPARVRLACNSLVFAALVDVLAARPADLLDAGRLAAIVYAALGHEPAKPRLALQQVMTHYRAVLPQFGWRLRTHFGAVGGYRLELLPPKQARKAA